MSLDLFAEYTVHVKRIPEHTVPGKPLGRHVRHDSRSLAYRFAAPGLPLKTNLVERYIPILNQGQVGSCTAEAFTGACGSGPLFLALSVSQQDSLNQQEAYGLYSDEETALGFGPYPPNDNGGDGLTICQVGKTVGYISGYTHCLGLNDVLTALSNDSPVLLGVNWYDSFDAPASNGLIAISPNAYVRGGHEVLARGIQTDDQMIFCDNSWGDSWGLQGSFEMSWDTLNTLLAQQGDGTVPVALNQPKPVPAVTP